MSVGVPPRNIPVFDPITGEYQGTRPNPDFFAFFNLGPGSDPNVAGGNPAGLGFADPDVPDSVRTPFTDIGVDTGVLFGLEDFEDPAAFDAALSTLVPEFYRDPITGVVDPLRAGTIDARGRPAGVFNQGMEDVALTSWARNNPEAAAELYWAMAPDGTAHLTPGEQRIIALSIGPDFIEQERQRIEEQLGLGEPELQGNNDITLSDGRFFDDLGGGIWLGPDGLQYVMKDDGNLGLRDGTGLSPGNVRDAPAAPDNGIAGPTPPRPEAQPDFPPDAVSELPEPGDRDAAPPASAPQPPAPDTGPPPAPAPPSFGGQPVSPLPPLPIVVGPGPGVGQQIPGQDFLPPTGPPAAGMVWDSINGVWVWPAAPPDLGIGGPF